MYREKANVQEIEMLRKSIDPHRAKSIFEDMREVVDEAMKDFH